jgi:hypothetical protein
LGSSKPTVEGDSTPATATYACPPASTPSPTALSAPEPALTPGINGSGGSARPRGGSDGKEGVGSESGVFGGGDGDCGDRYSTSVIPPLTPEDYHSERVLASKKIASFIRSANAAGNGSRPRL